MGYNPKTDFWMSFLCKLAAGGTAGAVANTICYPFDFARTRLASDVGSGKAKFNGIMDCIISTVKAQGITGLYTGWSVTVAGAFVYRAGQLGCFAQIQDLNPYKKDKGMLGAVSSFVAVTTARTVIMPFNCPSQIVAKEGMKGPYKGLVPELFRGVGGSLVI